MEFRLLCTFATAASGLGGTALAAVNRPPLKLDKTQPTVSRPSSDGHTYVNGSNPCMGLWNIYGSQTLKPSAANYDAIGTCS